MIPIIGSAARRAMRRHQGIERPAKHRIPLWRLLLGELGWALQQLWDEPRVLLGLVVGGVGTFAVLGELAPGPVLPLLGRVLVALVGGLVIARGASAWIQRGQQRAEQAEQGASEVKPAVAATEVVGAVATVVLLGWLVVWLVTLLR